MPSSFPELTPSFASVLISPFAWIWQGEGKQTEIEKGSRYVKSRSGGTLYNWLLETVFASFCRFMLTLLFLQGTRFPMAFH